MRGQHEHEDVARLPTVPKHGLQALRRFGGATLVMGRTWIETTTELAASHIKDDDFLQDANLRVSFAQTRGNTMKLLSIAVLGLLIFHSGVTAETRCSTDPYGNTTCRDSDGTTTRASTDPYGNTTYRRSDGTTTRSTSDPYGNTTFRRSDGSITRATSDPYGNTTYRHGDGSTTRATTDPYGNTTYRNSDGTTKRCSTDPYGNTTCR